MIWHFLKCLVSFVLPVFYKRVQSKNIRFLKTKGPVIIAMNHPNAFTDPIYLTYLTYPTRLNYLARGDVFKPGFASFMLEQIGIIPIFRVRDGGKEGLKKNDESYQVVNKLLARNGKIMVFAEGLCIQERRLRPLKKGVARMVFGAYEAINNENLVVIPVGVNYSQPDKFRSTLFYNIGEPILVKDFIGDYQENAARAQNKFLQHLEPRMKSLITHIDAKENDELVLQLEELWKPSLLKKQNLNPKNLADDFEVLQYITEKVNKASVEQPELVHDLKPFLKVYFKELKLHKLRDWLLDPTFAKKINYFNLCFRSLLIVLGFPLFAIGFLINYLPMAASHLITKKMIRNIEFYSSFVVGIGMLLFWTTYVVLFFILDHFSPHKLWPLLFCSVFILCGIFSLYYYPFVKKTRGLFRILTNRALALQLKKQRENILSLINKF